MSTRSKQKIIGCVHCNIKAARLADNQNNIKGLTLMFEGYRIQSNGEVSDLVYATYTNLMSMLEKEGREL